MPSKEWNEPLLVEYEFEVGAKRRKAAARLGLPRPPGQEREWVCPFQLSGIKNGLSVFGIKDGHVHLARGEVGLQALSNAVSAIRRSLARLKAIGDELYQFIFPKILPMSYGLEFHNKLCQIVDDEIAKKGESAFQETARSKEVREVAPELRFRLHDPGERLLFFLSDHSTPERRHKTCDHRHDVKRSGRSGTVARCCA